MPEKQFPNYPDMLKLFYRHNFPIDLGATATSVALAIIHKSNELYWPPDFKMSNLELSNLSGEGLTNIWRSRQKVIDRCKIGGIPLFSYVSNGRRRAGTYIINFHLASTLLQDDFKVTSNKVQKDPENSHDPNLPNLTKPNPTPDLDHVGPINSDNNAFENKNVGDGIDPEKVKKEAAKIDYGLLRGLNGAWTKENALPSQNSDSTRDSTRDHPKKRKEKNTTPQKINDFPKNKKTSQKGNIGGGGGIDSEKAKKERVRGEGKQVERLQECITKAFYPQITMPPPYGPCRSAIDNFGIDILEAAAKEASGKALNTPTPKSALNYVIGIARRGQSGLSYEQQVEIRKMINELKLHLESAKLETDLSKFDGVFIARHNVYSQEEFFTVTENEIERLEGILKGKKN